MIHFRRLVQRRGARRTCFSLAVGYPCENMLTVDTVDFVVVGTGAGGGTLACKLAESGFSVVAMDAGPYFRPLEDFASDKSEQTKLYWTDDRIVDGDNPIQWVAITAARRLVEVLSISPWSRCGFGRSGSRLAACLATQQTGRSIGAKCGSTTAEVEQALKIAGPVTYPWGPPRPRYPYRAHEMNAAALALARGCEAMGVGWTEPP